MKGEEQGLSIAFYLAEALYRLGFPWDKVGEMVKKRGLTYGQISDEDNAIGMRYLVTALPTIVVIDKTGKVQSVTIGDWGAVERQITELLQ